MFTEKEIAYLQSQPLARLATVSVGLQPDAVPVGFEFDGQYFYVGGHNAAVTRKYQNVRDGNSKVALVVDDLISVNPWQPRGLRAYGTAEIVEHSGRFGQGPHLRIRPTISWSWNIEPSEPGQAGSAPRRTVHI